MRNRVAGTWISRFLPDPKESTLGLFPDKKIEGTYYLFREAYADTVRLFEPREGNSRRSYVLYPHEVERILETLLGLPDYIAYKIVDIVWDLRRVAVVVPGGQHWVVRFKEEAKIYEDSRLVFENARPVRK